MPCIWTAKTHLLIFVIITESYPPTFGVFFLIGIVIILVFCNIFIVYVLADL